MTESRAGFPRVRQRRPTVAITAGVAGERGSVGIGKSSNGMTMRTRSREERRLFALRTTAWIRHADDDVDDSSRTDCHANHGTERPVIDSRGRSPSLAICVRIRRAGRNTEPSSVESLLLYRRRDATVPSVASNYSGLS